MTGTAKLALLIAAAVLGVALIGSLSRPQREASWAVRYEGAVLFIRSGEPDAYSDCDLELNDRYRLTGQSIPYHPERAFRMAEFAAPDGTRFSYRSTKPVNVYIRCRRPSELSGAYAFR